MWVEMENRLLTTTDDNSTTNDQCNDDREWKRHMDNVEMRYSNHFKGTLALLSSLFWHWASFHITGGLLSVPLFPGPHNFRLSSDFSRSCFALKIFRLLVRTLPVLTPICYLDFVYLSKFLYRVPVLVLTPVFGTLFTCFWLKFVHSPFAGIDTSLLRPCTLDLAKAFVDF